jgi:hypothetical protein
MHEPTDLRRPMLLPRPRGRIGFAAGLAAIFSAGVISAVALRPARPPVIEVSPPPVQVPVTHSTVLPFAVPSLIVLPAPAPPPPLAPSPPEPIEPPAPRATRPLIDAACVLPNHGDGTEDDVACSWDDGFPAISADGNLIASKYIPDDGGRGYPGLTIQITHTRTSRTVRSLVVLSPDEYLEAEDPKWPALRKKIANRAAAAQRVLEAGEYRPLTLLGSSTNTMDPSVDPVTGELVPPGAPTPPLRADFQGDAVRLIDTAAGTVLWQRRFPVAAEYPPENHDWDREDCYPTTTRAIDLAWDGRTRTVIAYVSYASGPCYCGDELRTYVATLPSH